MPMEKHATHLGGMVKAARKNKNLTQAALSATLGISTRHLQYIESGRNPSYMLFRQIVITLDIPVELVFCPKNQTTHRRERNAQTENAAIG